MTVPAWVPRRRHRLLAGGRSTVVAAVVTALAATLLVALQPPAPAAAAVSAASAVSAVSAASAPAHAIMRCDASGRWSTNPVGPLFNPDGSISGYLADPICDALRRLEDQAVTDVITARGLVDDRGLARTAARADVEAMMWARLQQAIRKPADQRSEDEALIIGWLSNLWYDYQLQIAQAARSEYFRWKSNLADPNRHGACTYVPPAPFEDEYPGEGQARWPGCFQRTGSLGGIFTGDGPKLPSFDDFVRWGSVRLNAELATTLPETTRLNSALLGFAAGAGAGAATGAALSTFFATASTDTIGKLFINVAQHKKLAELAVDEAIDDGLDAAQQAAKRLAAKLAARAVRIATIVASIVAVISIVDIVLAAVEILVTRILDLFVFSNSGTPAQLDAFVTDRSNAVVDLVPVLDNGSTQVQVAQLFMGSVTQTVDDVPAPERTVEDLAFRVTTGADAAGSGALRQTFTALNWAGAPVTVEMAGGYFLVTDTDGTKFPSTTLGIRNGAGQSVSVTTLVTRDGPVFVSVPADGSAICVQAGIRCPVSEVITIRPSATTTASVQITESKPYDLLVTGPTATTQTYSSITPFSVRAVNTANQPVSLSAVTWTAQRALRPTVKSGPQAANGPQDVCQPQPDGSPSTLANTLECKETGSGPTFEPRFVAWGAWKVTVVGKTPDGTTLRRSFVVDVANSAPVVFGWTCPPPQASNVCSTPTAPEGGDVTLRFYVADGPNETIDLVLRQNGVYVDQASLPCQGPPLSPFRDLNASIISFYLSSFNGPCNPGVSMNRVNPNSDLYEVTWKVRNNQPRSGAFTIDAEDEFGAARPAASNPALSLGSTGGWTNAAPVVGPVFFTPLFMNGPGGSTFSLFGSITDPAEPTLRPVSATFAGQPVPLPSVTPTGLGSWSFSWSAPLPGNATNTWYSGSLELVFEDSGAARTTTGAVFSVGPVPDSTPPEVTINDPFVDGWYGPLRLPELTVADPTTPIRETSGCGPQDVGPGVEGTVTVTCTARSDGGTTTKSFDVLVDTTPPTMVTDTRFAGSPTFRFGSVPEQPECTATDAGSGLLGDRCFLDGYSNEVGEHTLTFQAVDQAGNAAPSISQTYTVAPDADAPVVTIARWITGTRGTNGWYRSRTTVEFPASTAQPGWGYENVVGCQVEFLEPDAGEVRLPCTITMAEEFGLRELTYDYGVSLKIDGIAPTVGVTGGPQAGQSYTKLTLPQPGTCVAADTISGLVAADCEVTGWSSAVGSPVLRYAATDRAGNVTTRDVAYTVVDDTPPVITSVVSGTDGENGWFTTLPTVNWVIADDESPAQVLDGCSPTSLTEDGTLTATCRVRSGGGTAEKSVVLKADRSAPTITRSYWPAPWLVAGNLPDEPTCTATDAVSGVDGGCTVTGYSTQVGDHVIVFTATDRAGNVATLELPYTVAAQDDVTGPIVTGVTTSTKDPVNGWYSADVALSWTATDPDSPLTGGECPDVLISEDTGPDGRWFECQKYSWGGFGQGEIRVYRDSTAPDLEVIGGPVEGGSYLPADLPGEPLCRLSDSGSGVPSSTACTVTGFSAAVGPQTVTLRGNDIAGNVTTRTVSYTVLADTTPPVITGTATGPEGAAGWFTGDVTVSFDVSDAQSPIAVTDNCADTVVSTDTTGLEVACAAISGGGETSAKVTVKRDATGPELTVVGGPVEGASYPVGQVPAAGTCTASDATAGVGQECAASGWSSELGSRTVTYRASDVAGNETVVTRSYAVVPGLPGIPTRLAVVPGDRSARVTWAAPATDGGAPVTGYVVTASRAGLPTVTVETTETTATLTGLTAGQVWRVAVSAVNSAGTSAPTRKQVTPTGSPVLTQNVPAGVAGRAYAFTVKADAAPAPTYTVSAGALPPGLTLSAAGVLSGTPTTAGTYAFTLRAANGVGTPGERLQTMTVAAGVAAAVVAVSGSGQAVAQGAGFGSPLTAKVTDPYGNPVPGKTVTFTVTGPASFAGAASVAAVSGPDGVATAPALTAGSSAGTVLVRAVVSSTVRPAAFGLAVVRAGTARADLRVGVTGPAAVAAGATATAVVTVTNVGPQPAAGTRVVLTAAPGATVVRGTGPSIADVRGGYLTATPASIPVGGQVTYRVTLVGGPAGSVAAVTATAVSVTVDPALANNTASTAVTMR